MMGLGTWIVLLLVGIVSAILLTDDPSPPSPATVELPLWQPETPMAAHAEEEEAVVRHHAARIASRAADIRRLEAQFDRLKAAGTAPPESLDDAIKRRVQVLEAEIGEQAREYDALALRPDGLTSVLQQALLEQQSRLSVIDGALGKLATDSPAPLSGQRGSAGEAVQDMPLPDDAIGPPANVAVNRRRMLTPYRRRMLTPRCWCSGGSSR